MPKERNAGTEVEKPLIVERDGDRMIWRLQAAKADQVLQGMHLSKPHLELFSESGKMIPVRGEQAWFNPLSRSIRFEGAVVVDYGNWRLNSETLEYDSSKDELYVPGSFRIRGIDVRARGHALHAKRKEQRLWVEKGVWIEDSRPAIWHNPS